MPNGETVLCAEARASRKNPILEIFNEFYAIKIFQFPILKLQKSLKG
jgi:hypothetical protein